MTSFNGFTPTTDTWPIVNPKYGPELFDLSDQDTNLPIGSEDKGLQMLVEMTRTLFSRTCT